MTDETDGSLQLRTRIGHSSWDGNQYCGYAVDELAGRDGMWSLISLAVGGPRLGPEEVAVLDDLAVSLIAPDPRIWPLKMTRLASAYGSPTAGQCVGYLGIARSQVGGHTIGMAAQSLVDLERRLGGDWTPERLDAVIGEITAGGRPLPGFGVPYRPRDERVDVLRRCLQQRARAGGRYWDLIHTLAAHVAKQRPLPLNIGGAGAAVMLDLGFTADQVVLLGPVLLLPNYLANAAEGAEQRPAALLRLPDEVIDYVGAPPRRSPRAEGRE